MRAFILTICFLFFRSVLFGQALLEFHQPMMDNTISFFNNHYDTALVRKNKIESCQQQDQTFYFDSNGRVLKSVLIPYDSATQVFLYQYDVKGDLVLTEMSSPKYPKPIVISNHKTYEFDLLVKDSSSSGYMCKHFEYYKDGSLRQELWFGFDGHSNMDHRLQRAFWFGVDSLGRIIRVVERDYMGNTDSAGRLISNRTILYNEKGQMIKEEETVPWEQNNTKSLFCPNAGSAIFLYDSFGRLVEIIKTK